MTSRPVPRAASSTSNCSPSWLLGDESWSKASFAVVDPVPDIVAEEKLDALNARLEIDASQQVRRLAAVCFRLIHRFNASYVMQAPVDVGENGLFIYRFELVRGQSEETRLLHMRMALGRISDEYRAACNEVFERVRREVHGGR